MGKEFIIFLNTTFNLDPCLQVCLGFIEDINDEGKQQVVTNDYILKNEFHVDIGGIKVPAKANIHSPALAYKGVTKERTYFATQ